VVIRNENPRLPRYRPHLRAAVVSGARSALDKS
jgi:hypothetical protein